jgi:hypothetical protein
MIKNDENHTLHRRKPALSPKQPPRSSAASGNRGGFQTFAAEAMKVRFTDHLDSQFEIMPKPD